MMLVRLLACNFCRQKKSNKKSMRLFFMKVVGRERVKEIEIETERRIN